MSRRPRTRSVLVRTALGALVMGAVCSTSTGGARDAGDPITLAWSEGDVAGMTSIFSPGDRRPIGFVEYHQRRRGDTLTAVRVARFQDGSSDEDRAEARIGAGATLEALRGRSIIRDAKGRPTVDFTIDVASGHISGFGIRDGKRETYDEQVKLPPGTYWGPLIFLVVKNFDQNAEHGSLRFRTVAATPKPRVLDLEVERDGERSIVRPGGTLDVERFTMRPSINFLVDPLVHLMTPTTEFLVRAGAPPALARFVGPRNYAGQSIEVE